MQLLATKLQHRQQRKPTVPQSQLHQQQDVKLVSFALLVARFFGLFYLCVVLGIYLLQFILDNRVRITSTVNQFVCFNKSQ